MRTVPSCKGPMAWPTSHAFVRRRPALSPALRSVLTALEVLIVLAKRPLPDAATLSVASSAFDQDSGLN